MLAERTLSSGLVLMAVALALFWLGFAASRATITREARPVMSGPRRVVDGVTVGFADSEPGAEAAAAHYLLELERAMDSLSIERTASVARLVGTPAEASAMDSHAASVIAIERSSGVPLRRVAIATDPISYSPSAAEVTVLEEWIYATATREAVWAIERVSLVWRDGRWRVSAIAGAASSGDESLSQLRSQLEFPGVGDATVR
ncbi:hypothetical protein [Conexibacter sp. DBS9H8]|uniref:hypothetical protein n=1 Tax=Conexibacter sp. DBS9H8 TaxID=2937801 RepID=UPI0020100824|nr:hypothetical protein [Conexibacter sp. DBS9H8]